MESSKAIEMKAKARLVLIADLQLLIASLMFGFGFVAQRAAMIDGLGPLTFNALRYVVSAVIMLILMPAFYRNKVKVEDKVKDSQYISIYFTSAISICYLLTPTLILSNEQQRGSTSDLMSLESQRSAAPPPLPKKREVSWYMSPTVLANTLGIDIFHIYFSSAVLCLANFGASTLGQLGIMTISASSSAFITGFYVVFTPVLVYIIPQLSSTTHRPSLKTWLAVGGSMMGLFIISDRYDMLSQPQP